MQRIIYTLQQLAYLTRNEQTKKYSLGPKVFSLGLSVMKNWDLKKAASIHLEQLSRETGEATNLGILDGLEIVYIERVKTQHILNINLHIGSRLPAHCSSLGKAILAFLPEDQLEEILRKINFVPLTSHTITNGEALRKELKRVRVRGFSVNNGEITNGVRSVAAPIRDFNREVIAAVNLAVPSIRVSLASLETIFAKRVIETGDKISFVLGYRKEGSESKIQRISS